MNNEKIKTSHLSNVLSLSVHDSIKNEIASTLGVDGAELKEMYPGMVMEKEGHHFISHSDFGLIAIKAIQEQQEIIEDLQRKIEKLESRSTN